MRARRLRAMVCAAFVSAGFVSAGCSSASGPKFDEFGVPVNRPVTRAQLLALPEASLRYPGSVVVKEIGSDEVATREAEPDPAFTGAIMTARATEADLYAWYTQWLTAHGYHPVAYYKMTDQVSGIAWRAPHGREQVQVSVFEPEKLLAQQQIRAVVPTGGVVYEELLVGYRIDTR